MKILPSFTHPQVVVNLYGFLSSAENKGRCSRTIGIKKLFGTIDFIVEKNKYFVWKSMVPIVRKKPIQVCNNLRVSK